MCGRAGGLRRPLRPVADAARRRGRGRGPDGRRRTGPPRAPGGAAGRALHRTDRRGGGAARCGRTRPRGAQCRLNDPVTDAVTDTVLAALVAAVVAGLGGLLVPRLIARVPEPAPKDDAVADEPP